MTSPQTPQTFTYKVAKGNSGEDIPVPLDIYLPSSPKADAPPIPVIWVHTGGFLQGTRKFAPAHLLRTVEAYNYAVVAPDFRLAPQVSLQTVLEDIYDCIRFVLSGKTSSPVDISRYVLAGSSAGGWASLLLGLNLLPSRFPLPIPPTAVISLYPITTVTASIAPYFHKSLKPLPWAYSANAKKGDTVPSEPLQSHMDKQGLVRTEAPPASEPARATLYNYARQEGIFPSLLLEKEGDAATFCTPTLIKEHFSSNNNNNKAKPTLVFIAYGDADIMVETAQSDVVIDALKTAHINVKTHIEPGKSHIWDILEPEAEVKGLWESVDRALQSAKTP